MFVPVACSECGKPFQVPEAAVGKPTACPWCKASVLGLPVGEPAPAPRATPEPLSLDDDLPPVPAAPRGRRFPLWLVPAALLVLVAAAAVTIGVLRYKQGHLVSLEWRAFTTPDGSCGADLLGRAAERNAGLLAADGRVYGSEGRYSGAATWVGWRTLNAVQAQAANAPEAWRPDSPLAKVFDAERERVKGTYGGAVTKDATVKFADPLTRELRLETPAGPLVERMIVKPTGPNPRVYFVGAVGKNLDPDGPVVRRLFDSFRVNE